jgi:hypothetical protein
VATKEPTGGEVAEARQKQSEASKRATLAMLKGKSRATTEFSLFLSNNGNSTQTEVTMKFQAIGMREYDRLVSKYPPKPDQRVEGASFDIDTFAPALIAACSVEPQISSEEAQDIWDSPDWSRGDLMVLFRNAVDLNNRGLDIPFSERG